MVPPEGRKTVVEMAAGTYTAKRGGLLPRYFTLIAVSPVASM
jgi:hypothetical protein